MTSASGPHDDGEEPRDPLEEMLRSMLGPQIADDALRAMRAQGFDPSQLQGAAQIPTDPAQLNMLMAQVQRLMSGGGDGPVNEAVAGDLARQTAVHGGDPSISSAQGAAVRQALQVADLWLDPVTELTPAALQTAAWSRADWVTHTLPTWRRLAEPVAESITRAMLETTQSQLGHLPPELGQFFTSGGAATMLKQLGSAVFGMQVGQAVGTLATEAFGATDIGLPLIDTPVAALVPANVEVFTEDLDVPREEVRQYLAVRESAHARLFAAVPWLRSHLLGAVEAYAREIAIDVDAIEAAMRDLDPSDPAGVQDALREKFSHGGMFGQQPTPAQTSALSRLETSLALVEGWVEEVTSQAVAPHLPHQVALREMVRRRRATGGPAEQTFATLVGLELRPRRIREAAQLWATLTAERGVAERDGLWQHPDIMPTAEELDDPSGFVAARESGRQDDGVDAGLAALLEGTLPTAPAGGDVDGRSAGGSEGGSAGGPSDEDGPPEPDGPAGDAPRPPAD